MLNGYIYGNFIKIVFFKSYSYNEYVTIHTVNKCIIIVYLHTCILLLFICYSEQILKYNAWNRFRR